MKTAAFNRGQEDALRKLGLIFLGSGVLGGGGYVAHRLFNDPLPENEPVPPRQDLIVREAL